MRTDGIEFRTATAADAAGIARVLDVFSRVYEATGHDQVRLQELAALAPQWRVAVQAGEIVGAAHAMPAEVWFGRCRIRWANIGDVSVLESRQGEGIGSLVIADMVQWLRASGYAISRLGGLLRFYQRAGYEPFPRCYVEFPVSEFIRAGASEIPFTALLEPGFPGAGQVRGFDAERDVPGVWHVMNAFTRHRTGSRVFEQPDGTPDTLHDAVVYESQGQVRGVMHFREFEQDMSPFEASLMIYHLWYEPGHPAALDALVKHVLKRAYKKKANRVTAFLPFSDDVVHDLQRLGVGYTLCETMGALAGNMVQVGSLRALLEQIQPELQERVAELRWMGSITFDLGDQQASLRVTPAGVEVREAVESRYRLRLSHAEFCRAILGVLPPVWPRLVNPADDVAPTLNAMFPPVRGGYCS